MILTDIDKRDIAKWVKKFPKKRGALLMALRIVQDRIGWLSDEALDEVAEYLELERIDVYEVASFYTMYRREPMGTQQIKVCNSLSCCLAGSKDLVKYLEKNLGVKLGKVNKEGISLSETECLGACSNAPVAILNDRTYVESITEEVADKLIAKVKEKAVE